MWIYSSYWGELAAQGCPNILNISKTVNCRGHWMPSSTSSIQGGVGVQVTRTHRDLSHLHTYTIWMELVEETASSFPCNWLNWLSCLILRKLGQPGVWFPSYTSVVHIAGLKLSCEYSLNSSFTLPYGGPWDTARLSHALPYPHFKALPGNWKTQRTGTEAKTETGTEKRKRSSRSYASGGSNKTYMPVTQHHQ